MKLVTLLPLLPIFRGLRSEHVARVAIRLGLGLAKSAPSL